MSNQIITEIGLIKRYSRHNEAEDARFLTYLKVGGSPSNEELDKIVQETTDEVWKQIDCTSCGNCCKTLSIVVDGKDIARLSARLNMTPKTFAKRYVKTVKADNGIDESYFASSPCSFLDDNNCCTVYEDRPVACRDFPYLNAPRFRSRTLMTMSNTSVCPIVFNVWQRLKQRLFRKR